MKNIFRLSHRRETGVRDISKRIIAAGFLAVVLLLGTVLLPAAAAGPDSSREVIFLLDASNSMNHIQNNTATDMIREMAYSLPVGYDVGFVSYETDVQGFIGPQADLSEFDHTVLQTRYTGYSNAGAGLETALSLFSETAEAKEVVVFSDGEIVMSHTAATEEAVAKFDAMVGQAAGQGITIHTILLNTPAAEETLKILDASRRTGGSVYHAKGQSEIEAAAEQLLFSDLGVGQLSVGAGGARDGRLHITLPDTDMESAKILLTSDQPLSNITTDASAQDIRVVTGRHFAVAELTRPAQTSVGLSFTTASSGEIHARLIPEYQVCLQVDAAYREKELTESQPEPAGAIVTIHAGTERNPEASLFASELFQNQAIPLRVNGKDYRAAVRDGSIQVEVPYSPDGNYTVEADFSGIAGNFSGLTPVTAHQDKPAMAPPPPEPEPDYRPLIAVVALLGGVLLLILRRGRHKVGSTGLQAEASPAPPSEEYHFSGKLNLYIVRAPDDRDIPPQVFPLYRQSRKRVRLHYILSSCGIDFGDVGAREIDLLPGPDRSLLFENSSDCTVLKNRDLMMKGRVFPVHFEEKVSITFTDDSELILQYKNVRPNEER